MNFFFAGPDLALILRGSPIVRYDFSRPDSFTIDSWSGQLNLQLVRGKNPKEILYKATETIGRMPVLPDWALGTWLGLQGGERRSKRSSIELRMQAPRSLRFGFRTGWEEERPDSVPSFGGHGTLILQHILIFAAFAQK
jgi:hypothetical protein